MRLSSLDGVHPSIKPTLSEKIVGRVLGRPKNLHEKGLFHKLALIPFLAWVGLGADGLSSSSYGPQESFRALGEHWYLAVALALATAITIAVIASAYRRIIEKFPHGGGGYIVAGRLLGRQAGVVSGTALTVDYILTITVSIAAAGDALFSFLPMSWVFLKFPVEIFMIVALITMNLRGVREAITPLVPIFILFLVTHIGLLGGAIIQHAGELPARAADVSSGFEDGLSKLGIVGMLALFARAWSMGGGTYTGIEAVSNGLPILREPRVRTAHKTMLYMAVSLAVTAGGLMLAYLLVDVRFQEGQTLNAVLSGAVFGDSLAGRIIVIATLVSEGALLFVAAQAGFIDGPRILANMASDGWMPRRFSSLSSRLTTGQGIMLIGLAALGALVYTGGRVDHLVVMYSINVFLTFSLSMAGMLRASLFPTDGGARRPGDAILFSVGLLLCLSILCVTVWEKFADGGWVTLVITGTLVCLAQMIHRHYRRIGRLVARLDGTIPTLPPPASPPPEDEGRDGRTAVVLVGGYGGLGIDTTRDVLMEFKGVFRRMVFVSVGVVDSAAIQNGVEADQVLERTREACNRYVGLASILGMPAIGRASVATSANDELERVCGKIAMEYEDATFFAGQLVFDRPRWYHQWLHNNTAADLQARLQLIGQTLVIVPRLVSVKATI